MESINSIGSAIIAELAQIYEPMRVREAETHAGTHRHYSVDVPGWAANLIHAPAQCTIPVEDVELSLSEMTDKYLRQLASTIAGHLTAGDATAYHLPHVINLPGQQACITMHGVPLLVLIQDGPEQSKIVSATVLYSK